MERFRIDFAMNQGHEMIIDRESGIYRSELDDIEIHMLQNERIPYLLSMDWFELDTKVTFRYKLSGMKMLLHRLQQHPLTMEQYYTLILGIADALYECKHYMLRPEGCLLDEQFIFVGEKLHDIRLVYLPIKANAGTQSMGAGDLLSLIVRFTSYIEQIDGEGLKRVLHHLTGKKWPLEELRSTLLDLIGEAPRKQSSPARQSKQMQQEQKADVTEKYAWTGHQPRIAYPEEPIPQPPKPLAGEDDVSPFISGLLGETRHQQASSLEYTDMPAYIGEEKPDAKKKWIITAALCIVIACTWRFVYLEAATRQSLLLSSGITLLMVAAFILVWLKGANRRDTSAERAYEQELLEQTPGMFQGMAHLYAHGGDNQSASSKPSAGVFEGWIDPSAAPLHVVAANPVARFGEPTVLLDREQQQEHSMKPVIWLQRSWEGEQTKLELTVDCFKIGRIGEKVDYADCANGISRLHLEIESSEGEYKAKDLGSRNGSLLNGQTMIPYKSYKLSIGDLIHLAGEQGPAYELKSS